MRKIGGLNMNGEGYRNPTADRAIRSASRLPRQIWSVVKAVREVLNVSHLELVEIRMRDRTTGKVLPDRQKTR